MSPDVVDLFAGPGGWDVAAKRVGLWVHGLDTSLDACRTGLLAGHVRTGWDVAKVDPWSFRGVRGVIASPPCQGFSTVGKGTSRADGARLLDGLAKVACHAYEVDDLIGRLHEVMTDDRSVLTLEPLRWALSLLPDWLALEQVPAVLPIWQACARVLRSIGYSVATGVLSTEAYGVPQVRRRAVLLARAPGRGPVDLPAPTHSAYHARNPDRIDPGVLPWVTMSKGLGWWGVAPYPVPGVERFNDQSGTPYDPLWPTKRPSTVVAGRGLVQNPGASANRFNGSTKSRNDGVRVTVEEAARLQTFPDGYPWAGTVASRYQQIGDAVPPLFAEALLHAVIGETVCVECGNDIAVEGYAYCSDCLEEVGL